MSQLSWRHQLATYGWPVLVGLLVAALFLQKNSGQGKPSDPPAPLQSYADAVEVALPSVVNIYTSRVVKTQSHPLLNDPLFKRFLERNGIRRRDKTEHSLGSGVIVHSGGYVLTNNHVISEADRIRVLLADGRERIAKVIGTDAPTDLAVLKIDLDKLVPAIFADPDKVRIGDIVLAIGNPYGIGQTVTQGIVSATGRHGLNINTYEKYIQTDAAINRGNSGGALVNTNGQLIGINSGLYSRTGGSNGIGFAIPNDIASYVLENIISHGEVVRGWLGVSVEVITPAIAEAFGLTTLRGLVLTSVATDGPADKAGLRPGDIITHIDDQEIEDGNLSMHQIAQTSPGTNINVRAIRDGAAQSFLVVIVKRPEDNSS